MRVTINYTQPKICPNNPTPGDISKPWYVYFRWTDPSTQKRSLIKERKSINSFTNFKERLFEATALREAIEDQLKKGWNPITGEIEICDPDPLQEVNELSSMPFDQAITFALSKCEVSPRTRSNYTNSAKRIITQLGSVRIAGQKKIFDFRNIPVNELRKKHIKLLLDHCKKTFNWSNKAFNKHMEYFKATMGRLAEDEIIQGNPALGIRYLPETESNKFQPYTEEEKKTIAEYFFLNHYSFFVFWMMIYHPGMRPNEVLALQMSDIDLANKMITIVPDEKRDNSKTKRIRYIPIMDALFPLLREHLAGEYPANWYVFGSAYNKKNFTNVTRGVKNPDYFKPSPIRVKRDTATKYWNTIVIDELKINKYLYAAKRTGANDKISAGIPISTLRALYGHASDMMTEHYATRIVEMRAEQIRKLSPEFIKKPG